MSNRKKKVEPTTDVVALEAAKVESAIEEIVSDSLPRSVVGIGYKSAYRHRALEAGYTTKASRRCNGDWLAKTLEAAVLDDSEKLLVGRFERILDENGVRHEHWNRTTKGWQGRLRMSGSLGLRAVLKKQGFVLIEGTKVSA